MKKFSAILLIATLLSGLSAFEKWDKQISGELYFKGNSDKTEYTNNAYLTDSERETSKLNISTKFGIFISKSVLVGGGINYQQIDSEHINNTDNYSKFDNESYFISFTPYITKYFMICKNFHFENTIEIQAGSGQNTSDYNEKVESKQVQLGMIYSPSITYSLTPKVLFSFSLGSVYYNWTRYELITPINRSETYNTTTSYGADLGIDKISIGIKYIF